MTRLLLLALVAGFLEPVLLADKTALAQPGATAV